MYEFNVTPQHDNRMIRSILQNSLKISSRYIRRIVEERGVTVNGKPVYLTNRVRAGDVIRVQLPREQSSVLSEPMDLDVRYEDQEVIVVNKPPGRLTHPSARERWGSMLAGVQGYLEDQGQGLVPHSVHRLDRDTSGLVMFAKHAHAHHLFDLALRAGEMHRSYCALVYDVRDHEAKSEASTENADAQDIGVWHTIDMPICMSEEMLSRRVIDDEGQEAITHYRILGRARGVAFVQLSLETGRTHQIRLHMSSVGMPLVGDKDYKGTLSDEKKGVMTGEVEVGRLMKRQALHAFRLAWTHPVTRESQVVYAEPPKDIQDTWTSLGGNADVFEAMLRDTKVLSVKSDNDRSLCEDNRKDF